MIESRKMIPFYRTLPALLLTVAAIHAQEPEPPLPQPEPAVPAPEVLPAAPPPVPAAPPAAAIPAPVAPEADKENALDVQLSPSVIGVGEQALLSIRIEGRSRLEQFPQTIEVDGLLIQFSGTNSQSFSTGGKVVRIMELRYSVEGMEPGTYTIPAQTFMIDGKALTTRAIEITVNDGPPIDDALLPQAQLSTAKTEMWEGEEVPITVSVLMHRAVQLSNQPFPVIKSDGIAVSRFDRNARIDQTEVNGQLWNTWQMPSAIVAMRSGDITLGPAEVKLEAQLPSTGAQRDPFGGFSMVRRTLKIKSNALPIKVKPLPAEGKPEGFSGVVGHFAISARTDTAANGPIPVQLGDPVGFEILVTGMGNFDAIAAPALEKAEGLRAYKPKLSLENRGLGIDPGQKAFTQIIFADKPGPVTAVFALPYFDPTSGTYAVAKSQPIEFMVTGDPVAAAAADTAATAETRDYTGPGSTLAPDEDLRDILPNAVDAGAWYSLTASAVPVHPLLLHGVPATLLVLLLGAGAGRRIRALQLARRPPADAPRPCAEIIRDLHRTGLTRAQFYGFVSEYAGAWQYWKKAPVPSGAGPLAEVLAARDHWLYATNTEAAAAPVPADEQKRASATITSQLGA